MKKKNNKWGFCDHPSLFCTSLNTHSWHFSQHEHCLPSTVQTTDNRAHTDGSTFSKRLGFVEDSDPLPRFLMTSRMDTKNLRRTGRFSSDAPPKCNYLVNSIYLGPNHVTPPTPGGFHLPPTCLGHVSGVPSLRCPFSCVSVVCVWGLWAIWINMYESYWWFYLYPYR